MADKVLYFPYIRVPENEWFTRVLLYWDEVGSIVPSDYVDNPDRLGEYMRALVQERQVKLVLPGDYVGQVPRFEGAFLEMIDKNSVIKARRGIALKKHDTFQIHIEKFSSLVYDLCDMGLAQEVNYPWYEMENLTADLYMTYLASVLGKAGNLKMEPITDRVQSLSVYSASLENISKPIGIFRDLRMRVVQDILPAPTGGIPVLDLMKFKDRYRDLLRQFRSHIESSLIKITKTPDEDLRAEETRIFKEDLKEQIDKILALMRKRHWPQVTLGTMAAAMPLAKGIVTMDLASALLGLPPLAYAIYSAFSGAKERQEAILSSPLAYAALAQKRYQTAGKTKRT